MLPTGKLRCKVRSILSSATFRAFIVLCILQTPIRLFNVLDEKPHVIVSLVEYLAIER